MENRRTHLTLIQGVINRMAGNLFFLRGWTITLIAALLALFIKDNEVAYIIYFLLVLVLVFWLMDAYFLSQERLYRALYNKVRKMNENEIDFSMDVSEFKQLKQNTVIYAMCSRTLLVFYTPLVGIVLTAIYLTNN
ncbi:MAG: hypothetical protein U9Q03_02170 [Patescibacteria group bacterium]|nr:hypothetical protein [Patescibacteria group bacterium]